MFIPVPGMRNNALINRWVCDLFFNRCFGETLSTLNFARRAKMIKNKAVVNEDASGNVLQLQAEIRRLRERLERYRSSTSITPSPVSTPMTLTPSCPFPHSSSSFSMRSDDDKTIAELKEMLSASLLTREKTESENTVGLCIFCLSLA